MEEASGILSFLPFILLIVFFWLFLIRPQMKEAKRVQAMHDGLKVGDSIETVARMIGVIVAVEGNEIVVNIAEKGSCKVRMNRAGVARVIEQGAVTGDSDSKDEKKALDDKKQDAAK